MNSKASDLHLAAGSLSLCKDIYGSMNSNSVIFQKNRDDIIHLLFESMNLTHILLLDIANEEKVDDLEDSFYYTNPNEIDDNYVGAFFDKSITLLKARIASEDIQVPFTAMALRMQTLHSILEQSLLKLERDAQFKVDAKDY